MRTTSVWFFTALVASTLSLGYACGGNGSTGGGGGTGGSGSQDYVAICKQACGKEKTCSTGSTLDCNALCSSCKDPAKAATQGNACLAISDCTQIALCFLPVLDTCTGPGTGGTSGTGGLSGGTGGGAGSTGGTSGTGGKGGSGGTSGATGGAGGASGGGDCTTSCTKAYKCCMAALGTSVCNQLDPATLCASASTASTMAMTCQSGLAQYGKLSTAAACH